MRDRRANVDLTFVGRSRSLSIPSPSSSSSLLCWPNPANELIKGRERRGQAPAPTSFPSVSFKNSEARGRGIPPFPSLLPLISDTGRGGWIRRPGGMMQVSDNAKGLALAVASSAFIGVSFILKKIGLLRAGKGGVRAGQLLHHHPLYFKYVYANRIL